MDNNVKKICKRCLLRDLENADAAKIEKYKAMMKTEDRVEDSEYESRLDICQKCDKLNEGTCNACGCYVELRALGRYGRCPHKKW